MKCIKDIKDLAWLKFSDAEVLYLLERYDSAFYLGGYTVELLLKAVICKRMDIESFYDFDDGVEKVLSKEAYRPFKVHNYKQLLVLAGLYPSYLAELENRTFSEQWTTVSQWSEENRYVVGKTENIVSEFLESIKIVAEWIQKHL